MVSRADARLDGEFRLRAIVRKRRIAGLLMVALLAIPTTAPAVVGEWGDDNWLQNIIGPERLAHGDEFGCHGYEGLDIREEDWVVQDCSSYLTEFTNASRWGTHPISFGVPGEQLDASTIAALIGARFEIVGDMLTEQPEGLTSVVRNGGSLELGIADQYLLESAEEDSLVSIYWKARVEDLKLREDKDVISWLEQQDVWFTTWGEWVKHAEANSRFTTTHEGGTLSVELALPVSGDWLVPGSIDIQSDSPITSVTRFDDSPFPELNASDRVLREGWRAVEGGILLTLSAGNTAKVSFESELTRLDIRPLTTFNGLHHAITVVGHHTTNLFHWSSDFHDSDLVFTWLIERPAEIEMNWALPVIAICVLVATPVTIRWLVNRDRTMRDAEER
jgi:hypothetical protein